MPAQLNLFAAPPDLPEGLHSQPGLITAEEEAGLAQTIAALPFRPFEFHGYLGNRRVVSFGWRYDYNDGELQQAEEMPPFLHPLRRKAAAFAGLDEADFQHALITEYAPGAGIGWHRDRPNFAEVVGISLLAPCVFRLRRRRGDGWERASFTAEPRSAYLLSGPARTEWQHSIPPLQVLRYSITFRRLKPG